MHFLFEVPQGLVSGNNLCGENYTTKTWDNPDTSICLQLTRTADIDRNR